MSKFQETLKKYLDIFKGQETYFINDIRNLELFKLNPSNIKPEDIDLKVSVIDDNDFIKLNAKTEMTKHIQALKIDPRLANGDLKVVEDIANFTLNGKRYNLLHFASVYCNYHRPAVFPIYSEQYIDFYKRYIKEYKLNIRVEDLGKYPVFVTALNDLVDRFQIKGKLNYIEMRKFAWVYMEKVLQEADPLAVG